MSANRAPLAATAAIPLLAHRYEPGLAGYMRLQRKLLGHWLALGRPADQFVDRLAPRYRARYARAFGVAA